MNIKATIEQALCAALQTALPADTFPQLAGVAFVAGQRSAELTVPAVIVSCAQASESVAPGLGIYRAIVSVSVMSSVDESEDPDPLHRERVAAVESVLSDPAALTSLLCSDSFHVYGVSSAETASSDEDRDFVDTYTVTIDCQA